MGLLSRRESGATAGRRWGVGRASTLVLVVVLVLTGALVVLSELGYRRNEHRLAVLQTRLTGSLIASAPVELQATLARVVGLAAESSDPATTFRTAVSASMAPTGPFASASLIRISDGRRTVMVHLGSAPIRGLTSAESDSLYFQAARTTSLITTRAVGGGVQKIGYLLSARGPGGTYVVGASQQLPVGYHVDVPAGSPDSNLDFAIYFGRTTGSDALVETNATHLPLHGTVSQASVAFGNNYLTLVDAPKAPLAGEWSRDLPWALLVAGVVIAVAAATMTGRLVRRRSEAESTAVDNRALYERQRSLSETLQRSLLPKRFPDVSGVEMAARYVPCARDIEVGGDWFSVVEVRNRLVFVVGDVSGHGIEAAGAMAALRYTIRTLAKLGFDPGEILSRAGEEIDVSEDGRFATVLVGVLELDSNRVTVVSAGHYPPLVVHDDGARFIEMEVGTPLGIAGRVGAPTTFDLRPGSTILAFTDGLVEQRGERVDVGLERLASVAATRVDRIEVLVDQLLNEMTTPDHEDDIALLAIRLVGPRAPGAADPLGSGREALEGPQAGRSGLVGS